MEKSDKDNQQIDIKELNRSVSNAGQIYGNVVGQTTTRTLTESNTMINFDKPTINVQ
jgi:hypothetical protein